MLELDGFGAPISFNYANGSVIYSTGVGAILSVFVTLITFTYLCNNLFVMLNRKGSNVAASVADSVYTYNNTITVDDGFRLAVGLDPRFIKENIYDYLELWVE